MDQDLALIIALRAALRGAATGRGLASSLVSELSNSTPKGTEVARKILLGLPIRTSIEPLLGAREEVAMLASLIGLVTDGSTGEAGRIGEALSALAEKWFKASENRKLEEKVLRFRSLIASGVLGAMCGMIAAVGPLVGSLGAGLTGTLHSQPDLVYLGAGMAVVGSTMLGLYSSGKGLILNLVVCILVFAAVSALVGPITNFGAPLLW